MRADATQYLFCFAACFVIWNCYHHLQLWLHFIYICIYVCIYEIVVIMTRSSVYWTILFCLLFHGLGIYFIAPLEIALPMLPYCIHICSSCALLFHGCILISSVGSWHLFWVFVVHMKLIHMYGRHGLILPWLGSLSFNVDLCNLLLHWYMRWFNILLFALGLNLSQALTYNILKTWWSLVCFFWSASLLDLWHFRCFSLTLILDLLH
jgi:hypothetical protein